MMTELSDRQLKIDEAIPRPSVNDAWGRKSPGRLQQKVQVDAGQELELTLREGRHARVQYAGSSRTTLH